MKYCIINLFQICAPYVKQLQYTFLLEKADRYQLLLSAVKQLTVFDLLDGLPPLNKAYIHSFSNVLLVGLLLLGFTRRNDFFLYQELCSMMKIKAKLNIDVQSKQRMRARLWCIFAFEIRIIIHFISRKMIKFYSFIHYFGSSYLLYFRKAVQIDKRNKL